MMVKCLLSRWISNCCFFLGTSPHWWSPSCHSYPGGRGRSLGPLLGIRVPLVPSQCFTSHHLCLLVWWHSTGQSSQEHLAHSAHWKHWASCPMALQKARPLPRQPASPLALFLWSLCTGILETSPKSLSSCSALVPWQHGGPETPLSTYLQLYSLISAFSSYRQFGENRRTVGHRTKDWF